MRSFINTSRLFSALFILAVFLSFQVFAHPKATSLITTFTHSGNDSSWVAMDKYSATVVPMENHLKVRWNHETEAAFTICATAFAATYNGTLPTIMVEQEGSAGISQWKSQYIKRSQGKEYVVLVLQGTGTLYIPIFGYYQPGCSGYEYNPDHLQSNNTITISQSLPADPTFGATSQVYPYMPAIGMPVTSPLESGGTSANDDDGHTPFDKGTGAGFDVYEWSEVTEYIKDPFTMKTVKKVTIILIVKRGFRQYTVELTPQQWSKLWYLGLDNNIRVLKQIALLGTSARIDDLINSYYAGFSHYLQWLVFSIFWYHHGIPAAPSRITLSPEGCGVIGCFDPQSGSTSGSFSGGSSGHGTTYTVNNFSKGQAPGRDDDQEKGGGQHGGNDRNSLSSTSGSYSLCQNPHDPTCTNPDSKKVMIALRSYDVCDECREKITQHLRETGTFPPEGAVAMRKPVTTQVTTGAAKVNIPEIALLKDANQLLDWAKSLPGSTRDLPAITDINNSALYKLVFSMLSPSADIPATEATMARFHLQFSRITSFPGSLQQHWLVELANLTAELAETTVKSPASLIFARLYRAVANRLITKFEYVPEAKMVRHLSLYPYLNQWLKQGNDNIATSQFSKDTQLANLAAFRAVLRTGINDLQARMPLSENYLDALHKLYTLLYETTGGRIDPLIPGIEGSFVNPAFRGHSTPEYRSVPMAALDSHSIAVPALTYEMFYQTLITTDVFGRHYPARVSEILSKLDPKERRMHDEMVAEVRKKLMELMPLAYGQESANQVRFEQVFWLFAGGDLRTYLSEGSQPAEALAWQFQKTSVSASEPALIQVRGVDIDKATNILQKAIENQWKLFSDMSDELFRAIVNNETFKIGPKTRAELSALGTIRSTNRSNLIKVLKSSAAPQLVRQNTLVDFLDVIKKAEAIELWEGLTKELRAKGLLQ